MRKAYNLLTQGPNIECTNVQPAHPVPPPLRIFFVYCVKGIKNINLITVPDLKNKFALLQKVCIFIQTFSIFIFFFGQSERTSIYKPDLEIWKKIFEITRFSQNKYVRLCFSKKNPEKCKNILFCKGNLNH